MHLQWDVTLLHLWYNSERFVIIVNNPFRYRLSDHRSVLFLVLMQSLAEVVHIRQENVRRHRLLILFPLARAGRMKGVRRWWRWRYGGAG